MLYLWVQALHVIAIIAWMAGMFYLPRLYVYHAMVPADSETAATFKTMERKLLRVIMNPAMIVSLGSGIWLLLLQPFWLQQGWMHGKLLLVLLLVVLHGVLAYWRRVFAEGRNTRSHRFYRWVNEVPTVLLIGIVILVVVKPF